MTVPRDYRVIVYYHGKEHEMYAAATSCGAALKTALKERRSLRSAVRRHEASYEVTTQGAAS